jgi:S-methyl-5-thioribose-1-phosphate isomerase
VRTVDWKDDHLVAVDQTLLPHEVRVVELRSVDDVVDAIRRLAVRGAPAIGVTGGLGVALAAVTAARDGAGPDRVRADAARIRSARPTAANLAWGVDRVLARLPEGTGAVVAEAVGLLEADVAVNRSLASRGADLVAALVPGPVAVLTHCNTGGLACVEWGTALGIVRALHERGQVREVYADETRPLLQGARLTAFELGELGIPYRLVVDSAGPTVIARGLVDVVAVGADRIAANGDVANKIGTYPLALAAARAGVPFIVAAPESTLDVETADGGRITIEERAAEEVLGWAGARTAPAGAAAFNPAFDVTPSDLVTAIVTERRVVRPAAGERVGS